MLKQILPLSLLFLFSVTGHALNPGDILFICYNGDGDDSFGFVATVDIPAEEVIRFTDTEWLDEDINGITDGVFEFVPNEGDLEWTAPSEGLMAGEVVVIFGVGSEEPVVQGGGSVDGSMQLGTTAETVYAYQGAEERQPENFVAVIANHTGDSIEDTGLTAGVNALFMPDSTDFGEYISARSGESNLSNYAPRIADLATNWIFLEGAQGDTLCDINNFIVGDLLTEISLTLPVDPVLENAITTGTITLSTALAFDLVVELSSDDESEAVLPDSVTIPAGSTGESFDIIVRNDSLLDGEEVARVIALTSEANISNDLGNVIVADDDEGNPPFALFPGDILFICLNVDDDECFGFVAMTDIPGGETILFTDSEWDPVTLSFNANEGDLEWTSPQTGLSAGDVVIISDANPGTPVVTGGGFANGRIAVGATDDFLFAYQGTEVREVTSFLAAIGNNPAESIENTGLTTLLNAFFLTASSDYGEYIGPRSGEASLSAYAPLIADLANPNNWFIDNLNGDFDDTVCDSNDFIVGTPTPTLITIVDCGFDGSDFFIDLANPTEGLKVTSSNDLQLDFVDVPGVVTNEENPNRFLIPSSAQNSGQDFFRVESL